MGYVPCVMPPWVLQCGRVDGMGGNRPSFQERMSNSSRDGCWAIDNLLPQLILSIRPLCLPYFCFIDRMMVDMVFPYEVLLPYSVFLSKKIYLFLQISFSAIFSKNSRLKLNSNLHPCGHES